MVHLNVYECQIPGDDLRIWRYPSYDTDIPQHIDERFDSITIDTEASPTIAVPTSDEGRDVLEDETQYEPATVAWHDHLAIYSNLVQYGIIRHLTENHEFTPIQVNQNEARTNRVNEVYATDPISEPVDGLEIRKGLKVRSRFWDFPDQGPIVGLNFAYTTTNYFTESLDDVLDGTDNQEYWLKMNCPSDCPHDDCTFHGHGGLIGEFSEFADSGEACRYDEDGSGQYVALSSAVDGIPTNPPVERVAIESSYDNIRRWAVDKHGSRYEEIIEDIFRDRLGVPDYMDDETIAEREAKFEQEQLDDVMEGIDREFELPTGQTATFADDPLQIIT